MIGGYPYNYICKQKDAQAGIEILLFRFVSTKTKQKYIVRVEQYPNHFYAIKFYLRDHRLSKHKYEMMTNFAEVRPIIKTCMSILQHILTKDSQASFGFIGARYAGDGDSVVTKRTRVYRRMVMTYISQAEFEHIFNEEHNLYILLNKRMLAADPYIYDKVKQHFTTNYTNFD